MFWLTGYDLYAEAYNFAPQIGVWEIRPSADGKTKVNRQVTVAS